MDRVNLVFMVSAFTSVVGDVAWKLYDTYGFPIDLTSLMVEEKGFTVDVATYEHCKKLAQVSVIK